MSQGPDIDETEDDPQADFKPWLGFILQAPPPFGMESPENYFNTRIKVQVNKKIEKRVPLSKGQRKIVYDYRRNKCGKCGIGKPRRLQIHHIDEDSTNNDLTNLDLLCYECHQDVHSAEVNKEEIGQ